MPYIHLSVTQKLGSDKKNGLSGKIAECVKLLPGKPFDRTMIRIDDNCDIYRGGERAECAFMQTMFQKPLAGEEQKQYIEALYALFYIELGLDIPQIYFGMVELDTWGSRGTLQLEPY